MSLPSLKSDRDPLLYCYDFASLTCVRVSQSHTY
jgi:hypothetical protein